MRPISEKQRKKLAELEQRIERLSRGPEGIEAPLVRLIGPLLSRLGYAPGVTVVETELLLEAIAARIDVAAKQPSMLDERAIFDRALVELETNVENVERLTVLRKKPLVAYAAWLRRLLELFVHSARFVSRAEGGAEAGQIVRGRTALALPPLVMRTEQAPDPKKKPAGAVDALVPPRVLDLELGAIDHVLLEAADELDFMGRRRRLLETARQLLLDVNAALPLERAGVEARRRHITRELTRIDRLAAAGVLSDASLAHQMQEAVSRGERQRLHALLVAQHGVAVHRGDERSLALAGRALGSMWKKSGRDPRSLEARRESTRRSAEEMFGPEFVAEARRLYEKSAKTAKRLAESNDAESSALGASMGTYFGEGSLESLLAAQVAVDGAFEVGGALVPLRVEDVERRLRAVRFPTRELLLLQATEPSDIPEAAFDDPRTILLDLAAGRLLARRFVLDEEVKHERTVLRGEVRIYVLDGSGSMNGARARMRDAIVAAELTTLERRWEEGRRFARITFFYRYFDTVLHPLVKVDGPKALDAALADVLGGYRQGGTDIETALLASLRLVAKAKDTDPDLARAQIVLVTDGESAVSEKKVEAERAAIGIPVGFSVIALGQENAALRTLVARQRASGARAFYHFIPDAALEAVARGETGDDLSIHVPGPALVDPQELRAELGEVVDEMVSLGRARELEALESLDDHSVANFEIGLDEDELGEGDRARARSLYRDKRALDRQYARWFPPVAPRTTPTEHAATDDVEATLVVLAAVVDVVAVVQGTELARKADAIALLERLLPDSGLTPARYFAVVAAKLPRIEEALKAVHAATTPAVARAS